MSARDTLRLAAGLITIAVTKPAELIDRIGGWREYRASRNQQPGPGAPPGQGPASEVVHRFLGIEGCDSCDGEAREFAREMSQRLPTGHTHDAGDTLTTALWAIVRHTRPECVIETGVAQGISSSFILAALRRNDHGMLWSIDFPPVSRPKNMSGRAVAPELRDRWTYLHGATRRVLPRLLDDLGSVDVFLHDSLHTEPTMTFEFTTAWAHLNTGGVLVADDASFNSAFLRFSERVDREPLLLAERAKGTAVGLIRV